MKRYVLYISLSLTFCQPLAAQTGKDTAQRQGIADSSYSLPPFNTGPGRLPESGYKAPDLSAGMTGMFSPKEVGTGQFIRMKGSLMFMAEYLHGKQPFYSGYTYPSGSVQGNATISVGLVPVSITGFASNYPGRAGAKYLNYYSIGFDHQQFQQLLKERLKQRLLGGIPDSIPAMDLGTLKKEYDSLALKASDPRLLHDEKLLAELKEKLAGDTSWKQYGDTVQALKPEVNDSLNKKFQGVEKYRYENAQRQLRQYSKLKESKDKLQALRAKLDMAEKNLKVAEKLQQKKQYAGSIDAMGEDELTAALAKAGMMNRSLRFLYQVKQVRAGRVNPVISPLLLSGLSMDGVDIELEPGIFYLRGISGKVNRLQRYGSINTPVPPVETKISSLSAGIGSKNGTHIHFTLFNGSDVRQEKENSENLYSLKKADQNIIAGADARIDLLKGLALESEYYRSYMQQTLTDRENTSFVDGLQQALSPLRSISGTHMKGQAFTSRLVYNSPDKGMRLFAGMSRTGSGYHTVGIPFLRKDLLGWDVGAEKRIWKEQISISTQLKEETGNFSTREMGYNKTRTMMSSISLNKEAWPLIALTYSPFIYSTYINAEDTDPVNYVYNTWGVVSSYAYQLKDLKMLTGIVINRQAQAPNRYTNGFNSWAVSLNHSLLLTIPLQLDGAVEYRREVFENSLYHKYSGRAEAAYTFFGKLTATAGAMLYYSALQDMNRSYTFKLRYPVSRCLQSDLQVFFNKYDSYLINESDFSNMNIRMNIRLMLF